MTELQLRDAVASDIPALHRLIESAYRGESSRAGWTTEADLLEGQRTDPDELAGILADPDQALLTGWRDGSLVASVLIARRGETLGYFGMLSVDPGLQSAGLGRRMVAAAETALADRFEVRRIRIQVFPQRATLIGWYRRLGYGETGETIPFPYDDPRLGLPLLDDLHFAVMEKVLP
ncbi:GNAT family N-acetyltransferase [Brevundimonas sp. R86498]|uniref:GNAT family N-acetyltransferase n=1 Tax=Brevundimonas sp. R86498 TaxID=3093845 RepID=UPI0037CC2F45